ncbi:citrate-binding protein-like [Panicum virgatum]|uniref:citrate-binding protein-like n=1 Tax=Panicum virgatum TaxID=38727 RepID=UPI0019D62577|nr:citrate-binding protein-like [Panicum virgatum]
MAASRPSLLLLLLASLCAAHPVRGEGLLTDGFTAVELTEAQFKVQKPYDVPLGERYELLAGGVRRMWVYAADKPITTAHPGGPRTEIKIEASAKLIDIYIYLLLL